MSTVIKSSDMFYAESSAKRLMLICGYITKQSQKCMVMDIAKIIDLYSMGESVIYDIQQINFSLSQSKGECPFNFRLTCNQKVDVALGLQIGHSLAKYHYYMRRVSSLKIYYQLYIDGDILFKGVTKYERKWWDKFHKIAPLNLLDNYDGVKLLIQFLYVKYHKCQNYFKPIIMQENMSYKWTIKNDFKHKSESMVHSNNFANNNFSLYYKYVKNPTDKKKKKFYIGLILFQLPNPIKYLKMECSIWCNDEKNTKKVQRKMFPGFHSSNIFPFKHDEIEIPLNINVKIKILQGYGENGKEINFKYQ